MTTEQTLVVYLTGAALTLCWLGIRARLPGQSYFEEKMRAMTRARLGEMLLLDPDDPDADEDLVLTWMRRHEILLVIPALILVWPLYLLTNLALSVYVALIPAD